MALRCPCPGDRHDADCRGPADVGRSQPLAVVPPASRYRATCEHAVPGTGRRLPPARHQGDQRRAARQRISPRAGTLGFERVAVDGSRRCARTGDRAARTRLLQPVLEPDRAFVRGGDRRSRGRRRRVGVRVGHGGPGIDRAGDLLERRPHRRPAPAVRGHDRVPAGPMRTARHRADAGRRHRAWGVRGRGATGTHDARAGRDAVEPASRARRSRRAGGDQGPVDRGRLDVRHTTRPTAARPRRRHRRALGDEGHRRPQRRDARRDRRRAGAPRRDLVVLRVCTAQHRRRSTRSTRCAAFGRWRCGPRTRRRRRSDSRSGCPTIRRSRPFTTPGSITHPQHDLAKRQMRQAGTVLAFELTGGEAAARSLLDRVGICRVAASLGGPETLLCHPATSTHVSLTADEQAATGVTPGLVRMSVGLEDADDLVADLTIALCLIRAPATSVRSAMCRWVFRRSDRRAPRRGVTSSSTRRNSWITGMIEIRTITPMIGNR